MQTTSTLLRTALSLLFATCVSVFGIPADLSAQEPEDTETDAASPAAEEASSAAYTEDSAADAAPLRLEITEWPVPWPESRPRDPYVVNDSTVWFVGQRANYLATLNPQTGEFDRYDLPEGAGPHNVIVGPNGRVWYAGNRDTHIGELDPATGEVTVHRMPDPAARDPHTLNMGPEGDIWFTVQGGNFVGLFHKGTGEIDLIPVPTEDARPYGIVVTGEGRPWIAELGTNKIGTVDPATMDYREYELPREDARPRRIALTPDGLVWSVDYAGGHLTRLNPETGVVREWLSPGGAESQPYAMASDGQGRLWFVETGPSPNRLVGFDPASGEFFSVTPVPSGGGTVRHMVFDPGTHALWFGTDTNTIGRARLP